MTTLEKLRRLLDKIDDERFRDQIKQLIAAEEAEQRRGPPLVPSVDVS